mgnify:CR=1 FL=1
MNADDTIFQGPNAAGTITENVISYELIQFLELVNIFLFLISNQKISAQKIDSDSLLTVIIKDMQNEKNYEKNNDYGKNYKNRRNNRGSHSTERNRLST